ncbi:MAG: hypothetical protein MRY49_01570 [Candidatus Pacebacteria bacterium]|nr:hypothetical protein [Candidatus Paceibacterota bacterium]
MGGMKVATICLGDGNCVRVSTLKQRAVGGLKEEVSEVMLCEGNCPKTNGVVEQILTPNVRKLIEERMTASSK